MLRDTANSVARSFNDGEPAALAVTQLTKFEVVVSGKTAKALGLVILQSVLLRADDVIK